MNSTAHFRFYGSLNDFLPAAKKESWLSYNFKGNPALKDAIEAIGIPHPEVFAILVNRVAVDFFQPLQAQQQVEVYPAEITPVLPENYLLKDKQPSIHRFILDVHLGKLAKTLRMLGFDCRYENEQSDQAIASIAEKENRIVLTRDVGLLKHKAIRRGYWLRSRKPEEQLEEVIHYFNLQNSYSPFSRCLACNGRIEKVSKESVSDKLPPQTNKYFNEFFQCFSCRQVYWKGSHYERMQEFLGKMLKD